MLDSNNFTLDKSSIQTYNGGIRTKGGINVTEERRKQIKEIVLDLQQMSRESLILMKNAADVLKIRDSMEKKAG